MLDLSIIIVSWNAQKYVQQCLSTLRTACEGLTTEILVVDNASSDGTPALVEREFPEAIVIRNSANIGFARANNIGMRLAAGRYFALINSDVEVPSGCLQTMVSYLDSHPAVGLLGPGMLTPSGSLGPSCMRRPRLTIWLAWAIGLASICPGLSLQIANPTTMGTSDVDILNGWFWMARKSAVAQVGLLDEQFFMYGEDMEWCHRFWDKQWKVVYLREAEAVHYGGASSARAPIRFYLEMQRANYQYWRRYHGPVSRAAYIAISVLHHTCRVLGHGVLSFVRPSSRQEAEHKVKRSAASLKWLISGSTSTPDPLLGVNNKTQETISAVPTASCTRPR